MAGTFRTRATCMLLLVALTPVAVFGQGTLGQLRDEVRREEPSEPPPPPPSDDEDCQKNKKRKKKTTFFSTCDDTCDPCEEEEDDGLWSGIFDAALAGAIVVGSLPFRVPGHFIEGQESKPAYFTAYPFADGAPGAMLHDIDDNPGPPPGARLWNRQLWLEYGDDFSGLSRASGKLLMDQSNILAHIDRWGFDLSVTSWREALTAGGHDQLWTGDANLLIRFAQNERVQLRAGLGVNWLADDVGSDFGFNFTYSGDFYPCRPVVLSAELDAGWLGAAWLVHFRATTGVHWRRTEFYLGYDLFQVGSIDLDGLVFGTRINF